MAWNISTAIYDNKYFSVINEESLSRGMFLISGMIETISLGSGGVGYTAGDVIIIVQASGSSGKVTINTVDDSGAVLTVTLLSQGFGYIVADNLSVTGGTGSGATINILAISSRLYVVGTSNNTVYQYSLSTVWDISTASYSNKSISVANETTSPMEISFKSDGSKMYILGYIGGVYQYSLSTAWDVSTATYDNVNFDVHSEVTSERGIFFKSDGSKMYIVDSANSIIFQYSLSAAWDVSTASYTDKSFDAASEDVSMGAFFSSDGSQLWIVGYNNKTIYQYSLSVAWDISTASYDGKSFDASSQVTYPQDLFFAFGASKIYIIDSGTDAIYQYSLSLVLVTTEAASSIGINHAKGNGTASGANITERGFEVKLAFSGTLREAINRSIAGFKGDFSYNLGTGKWEGTLVKTVTEEGEFEAESFVGDLGRFPIAVASDKLFAAETYNYMARATMDEIVYYGDWVEFTTASYPSGEGPGDDAVGPEEPIIEPIPEEPEEIPFWEWPEIVLPPWEWPEIDIPPFEYDPSIIFGPQFGVFLRRCDTKKDWETLREKCIIYQENMNSYVLTLNHNILVMKNFITDIITYVNGDVYPSDLVLMISCQHLTPLYMEEISPDGFKDIINDFRFKDVSNTHDLVINFRKMLNSLNSLYESDYTAEPMSYNAREYLDIEPTAKRMISQLEDMRRKSKEVRRLTIRNFKRIFTYV